MKRLILLTFFVVVLAFAALNGQVPQGFNYQAIARDASGNPITGATIKVKLSILSDTTGFKANGTGTYIWEEEHINIKTNAYGLFTVNLGTGIKTQGSAPTFSAIQWVPGPLHIGTKVANPTTYKIMGSARLWSVPYSMVAGDLDGSVGKFKVRGGVVHPDSALFEVKNSTGQTIFAVYNEGVRIFVDDGAKGAKGGFAVGGFGSAKAPSQEYLRVTRDSTRVFVNENVNKASKGGFAVGGFSAAKEPASNFMDISKNNYFIGHQSGLSNTTGLYNSFMGFESGVMANASYNTFFGYQTGKSTTWGDGNLFMGYRAGTLNTSGYRNVFLGYNSGRYNISGYENTFVGGHSGYGFNEGNGNTMIGTYAGNYFYGGLNNIFIGNESGFGVKFSTTLANNNAFIGYRSGRSVTTGSDNTFIGTESGFSNNTGTYNVFIGNRSGYSNTSGYNNIFIGYLSGENASGNTNSTFIGNYAGQNITGDDNISIGDRSGTNNYSATHEMFGITILGIDAGRNYTGNYNTILGYGAGSKWGSAGSGSGNTFVGANAGGGGASALGDYNVCIGYNAGNGASGSSKLYISNGQAATPLIYGDFASAFLNFNGAVGLTKAGTNLTLYSNPLYIKDDQNHGIQYFTTFAGYNIDGPGMYGYSGGALGINQFGTISMNMYWKPGGEVYMPALPTASGANPTYVIQVGTGGRLIKYTMTSSRRFKHDIENINDVNWLYNLRPVTFVYNNDALNITEYGLIAEEVEQVNKDFVVYDENNQVLSVKYNSLISPLVKAVQEQKKTIDEQRELIEKQNELINSLAGRIEKLEKGQDRKRK